jgi:hypothetical protein
VFPAEKVVVTQPSAGEFKAFSAVCTHLQCVVDQVANGTIDCGPVDQGGGREDHAGLTPAGAHGWRAGFLPGPG